MHICRLYVFMGNSYQHLGLLSSRLYEESCYFGELYYEALEEKATIIPLSYYFKGLCQVGLKKNSAAQKPISPHWLCHCINEVVDQDGNQQEERLVNLLAEQSSHCVLMPHAG